MDGTELSPEEFDLIIDGLPLNTVNHQSTFNSTCSSPISSFIKAARIASSSTANLTPYLACFQLNLHRSLVPLDNLFSILGSSVQNTGDWVCLLQEPNTNHDLAVSSVLSSCVAYYDSSSRPRASIILPRYLPCTFIPHLSNPDFCSVRMHRGHNSADILLCSVYMVWPSDKLSPLLEQVVNFANAHNLALVIGADGNAHHPFWGSSKPNKRGEILTEFLTKCNLSILNDGSPTFHNAVRKEALDLTICNNIALHSCTNWMVSASPSLSDHSLIRYDVSSATQSTVSSTTPIVRPPRTVRHKHKQSDHFVDVLEDELRHYQKFLATPSSDSSELNDKAELLVRLINKADNKCVTKRYISLRTHTKKLSAPW